MTNRELLNAAEDDLLPADRQRLHALRLERTPAPCPVCSQPLDALTAARVDIDQYDPAVRPSSYRCPTCRAELERVPAASASDPGWQWHTRP